ncbi:MAG: hypothetical protein KC777_23235, partial [Cyanobacteria bacterium HKST-UBA02]|nr:hypothetical protein [Cyanobacteria bacterium HKST-UBA02]
MSAVYPPEVSASVPAELAVEALRKSAVLVEAVREAEPGPGKVGWEVVVAVVPEEVREAEPGSGRAGWEVVVVAVREEVREAEP